MKRILIEMSERNPGFFYAQIDAENGNTFAAYVDPEAVERIVQIINRDAVAVLGEPVLHM
jgi:hypothetical protein